MAIEGRRLEREAQRNIELMWLTGRLAPDFKTIARFRRDNGKPIRDVCRQFVMLCQRLGLFAEVIVAIDGSKFKAVNHPDGNFTNAKLERRMRDIGRELLNISKRSTGLIVRSLRSRRPEQSGCKTRL